MPLIRRNHRFTLIGKVLFAVASVRNYGGESYTVLKITVDDGNDYYELLVDERKEQLPHVRVLEECKILVTFKKRGADSTLIKGNFSQS